MTREFPKNPEAKIELPTVGRIVLFQENKRCPEVPAIVVSIAEGSLKISALCVFTVTGPEMRYQIGHVSEASEEWATSWDWMAYQKGQARKTEELEAALKEQAINPLKARE